MRIHKAWLVCAGCMLLLLCSTGMVSNGFSIYLPFILSEKGFTNTQVSFITTMRSLSSLVAMFLVGFYYKLLPMRKGMALAMAMVAGGFFLFSLADSYPSFLFAAVVAGFGYSFGSMIPVGIMLDRWFKKNLSSATGICSCITGFSTLGTPSLITWSVGRFGLGETFRAEAIVAVVFMICSFLLLGESPEACGCRAYGEDGMPSDRDGCDKDSCGKDGCDKASSSRPEIASTSVVPGFQPVLSNRVRMLLLPIALLTGTFSGVSYAHLSVLMTGEDIPVAYAAIVITLSGLALTCGKFLFGISSDHITTYRSNWIFGLIMIIGLFSCVFTCIFTQGNLILMAVSIIMYSFGLGVGTTGLVIWAKDLSREGEFEKSNQFFHIAFSIGALIFSPLPGILADQDNGSYMLFYLITAVCSVVVLLVIQGLYRRGMRNAGRR